MSKFRPVQYFVQWQVHGIDDIIATGK